MNLKIIILFMCLVSCITSFGADIPRVYLCRICDISVIKAKDQILYTALPKEVIIGLILVSLAKINISAASTV